MQMTFRCMSLTQTHLTPAILDKAIDFILAATTPVLIHCRAGVSRSAAVTMAYLIRVHGKTYQEAKLMVKEKRPCASPNTTFLRNVLAYYEKL